MEEDMAKTLILHCFTPFGFLLFKLFSGRTKYEIYMKYRISSFFCSSF